MPKSWAGPERRLQLLGQARPGRRKLIFNLIDRAKLLSYVMLASNDGFMERIDNAHSADTIQSSWVLWGRSSLCFLQKIRMGDSVSTNIEVNATLPGRKIYFRGHAAGTEPIISLKTILLNFTTMIFFIFYRN